MTVAERMSSREAMRLWIAADPQGVRDFIEERVQMVPWSGCWLWDRALTSRGYGNISKKIKCRQRWFPAHALAYEAFVGTVPDGLILRHKCDVPACVNPDHLEVGTQADNIRDMVERGRSTRGERNGTRTKPERVARGERAGGAKLTEARVRRVFEMRAAGMLLREIGAELGVSLPTVCRILSGKAWAHITSRRR